MKYLNLKRFVRGFGLLLVCLLLAPIQAAIGMTLWPATAQEELPLPCPLDPLVSSPPPVIDMTADHIRSVIAAAEQSSGVNLPLNERADFIVRACKSSGVPVWLLMAQAKKETSFGCGPCGNGTCQDGRTLVDGSGRSYIGNAHNIFNIKRSAGWTGSTITLIDRGVVYVFKAYAAWEDSIIDYVNTIRKVYDGLALDQLIRAYAPAPDPDCYIRQVIRFVTNRGVTVSATTLPMPTILITAGGGNLYQLNRTTHKILRYNGTPLSWQEIDNNPGTLSIVASGANLYQLHDNGKIWKYKNVPLTGWDLLDNNPATIAIAADGGNLYQLHNSGLIWKYTGTPITGWQLLDGNPPYGGDGGQRWQPLPATQ